MSMYGMHPKPVAPQRELAKAAGVTLALSPETAADRARKRILDAIRSFWVTTEDRRQSPDKRPGEDVLGELLANIDHALERIGDRKGERADAARAWLTERRETYQRSLDAFASVGPDLKGPAVVDLLARITAAEIEVDRCEVTFTASPPDRALLAQIRSDWDVAIATANEGVREAEKLAAALARPRLIETVRFGEAERDCRQLKDNIATPHRAMHMALTQAFEAGPDLARLWVVFEPAKPGADLAKLYELRAAAYAEAHP